MEAHINENPNTLSAKWPRVVTRPDIERALVLWIQHMKHKGETVTSHMLCEKWKRFENEFDVPEKERLLGKAGSIDHEAVEHKREHCHRILAKFAPQDQWNFDKTSFFP